MFTRNELLNIRSIVDVFISQYQEHSPILLSEAFSIKKKIDNIINVDLEQMFKLTSAIRNDMDINQYERVLTEQYDTGLKNE